jgi:hypothetical protein
LGVGIWVAVEFFPFFLGPNLDPVSTANDEDFFV